MKCDSKIEKLSEMETNLIFAEVGKGGIKEFTVKKEREKKDI
jgi:hypothetical protein